MSFSMRSMHLKMLCVAQWLAALQVFIDRQHGGLLHSCDLNSHLGSLA